MKLDLAHFVPKALFRTTFRSTLQQETKRHAKKYQYRKGGRQRLWLLVNAMGNQSVLRDGKRAM